MCGVAVNSRKMARAPAEAGETALGRGAAGQRLGKLVAARFARSPALPRGGQLVRFVEDREIVGGRPRLLRRRSNTASPASVSSETMTRSPSGP